MNCACMHTTVLGRQSSVLQIRCRIDIFTDDGVKGGGLVPKSSNALGVYTIE